MKPEGPQDEIHKLLALAEARAEAAERACVVREATLQTICDYIDREQHRARTAARALANSPELIEKEKAFARAHEMSTVADIVKRTAYMVTIPSWVTKWVHPRDAERAYQQFLICFQQLQDQQAMTDDNGWDEYRSAIALLGPKPGI